MYPGPGTGVSIIRGVTGTGSNQPPLSGSDPVLIGFSLGELGGMALAVVTLAFLGLVAVFLWHADITLSGVDSGSSAVEPTQGGSTASGAEPSGEPGPDVEVDDGERVLEEEKTDAETVVGILTDNGGRMRQAEIVETTGWSKSKVSMVLSDMEEDDEVSKLRVGRENIVSLQGSEPEAAGSPFDDE